MKSLACAPTTLSNKQGKALAAVPAPARATGNGLATTLSHQKHNTATQKKLLISDLLHERAENGTTLTELVQLTGDDERTIRRRIQVERKAGKLILADNKSGYFLPASEYEVRRFIRSMSNRAREIAAVACVAEDTLARMTGQERMVGW